jgi:hypothetical protein
MERGTGSQGLMEVVERWPKAPMCRASGTPLDFGISETTLHQQQWNLRLPDDECWWRVSDSQQCAEVFIALTILRPYQTDQDMRRWAGYRSLKLMKWGRVLVTLWWGLRNVCPIACWKGIPQMRVSRCTLYLIIFTFMSLYIVDRESSEREIYIYCIHTHLLHCKQTNYFYETLSLSSACFVSRLESK